MAVELNRISIGNRSLLQQSSVSKAALNASMERAELSQKYWNELLERLAEEVAVEMITALIALL